MSVDATELRRKIEELVDESPDFVYEPPTGPGGTCFYTHADGTPGCLVGRALHALGLVIPWGVPENSFDTATGLYALGYITGDRADAAWASSVQFYQDKGHTWAEALEMGNDGFGPEDDEDE